MTKLKFAIGLGSNLGSRQNFLDAASHFIQTHNCMTWLNASLTYESPALKSAENSPIQSDYLNKAVLVESTLCPDALLEEMLKIERILGRVREQKWGPRTIDLDLLLWEGGAFQSETLRVPHPQWKNRLFVLEPLAEIWPEKTAEFHPQIERLKIQGESIEKKKLSLPKIIQESSNTWVTGNWENKTDMLDVFCSCLKEAFQSNIPSPQSVQWQCAQQTLEARAPVVFYEEVIQATNRLVQQGYVIEQICIDDQDRSSGHTISKEVFWVFRDKDIQEKTTKKSFEINIGISKFSIKVTK